METLDPAVKHSVVRDYSLAQQEVQLGVTTKRSATEDNMWDVWSSFCHELGVNPLLNDTDDPVPLLQVYARRLRTGVLSPSKSKIRKRSVEGYLRNVGQTLQALGSLDPRQSKDGKTDFRLQRQLASYQREDPAPLRVKPVPIQVIRRIMHVANSSDSSYLKATADMIALAFFFLLRPGEYTSTSVSSTPFRFLDAQFYLGSHRLPKSTASPTQLLSSTFVTLEFTTQKNGRKGEVMGLSRSKDPHLCPILASARRVLHLREHNADPTTPLATYYHQHAPINLVASDISKALKNAVTYLGPSLGFTAKEVSARSMRASGAMALYHSKVDALTIRLIGRWNSDAMLEYLHVQSEPAMRGLSEKMVNYGKYHLHPNTLVPQIP